MLTKITTFFSERMLIQEVDQRSRQRSIETAVAALLIEVSRADHELSAEEQASIKATLTSQFDFSTDDFEQLYALAEAEVEEAISLYQFTQLVNQQYSHADKLSLIASMWKVAFADGEIDKYEDYLIRKVAELIYVSHGDFIKQKLLVSEQLGV